MLYDICCFITEARCSIEWKKVLVWFLYNLFWAFSVNLNNYSYRLKFLILLRFCNWWYGLVLVFIRTHNLITINTCINLIYKYISRFCYQIINLNPKLNTNIWILMINEIKPSILYNNAFILSNEKKYIIK